MTKAKTRAEVRAEMDRLDREATKLGQEAARKYLRKREEAQPTGLIREAIATLIFIIIMTVIVGFLLAL